MFNGLVLCVYKFPMRHWEVGKVMLGWFDCWPLWGWVTIFCKLIMHSNWLCPACLRCRMSTYISPSQTGKIMLRHWWSHLGIWPIRSCAEHFKLQCSGSWKVRLCANAYSHISATGETIFDHSPCSGKISARARMSIFRHAPYAYRKAVLGYFFSTNNAL